MRFYFRRTAYRTLPYIMLTGVLFVAYTTLDADGLFLPLPSDEVMDVGDTICLAPEEERYYYQDNHTSEFYEIIYPKDGPDVVRGKNGEIVAPEEPGTVPFIPRTETPRVDMIPPGNFFNERPGMFSAPPVMFPYYYSPSGKGNGGRNNPGGKGNCASNIDAPNSLSLSLLTIFLLTCSRKKV